MYNIYIYGLGLTCVCFSVAGRDQAGGEAAGAVGKEGGQGAERGTSGPRKGE